jgi:hypothetical protein
MVLVYSFLAAIAGGSPITRCECVVFPTTEADRKAAVRQDLEAADVVFVGTAEEVVDTGDTVGRRFRVEQVWKGSPGPEVVLPIIIKSGGNSCWYMPNSGRHLVFATKDSSGWFIARSCGSTGPIEKRAEASGFLKELCSSTELCRNKSVSFGADQLPNLACSRQRRVP